MKLKLIRQLLIEAFEKKEENKARDMWLTLYPNMRENSFISFEDFYKKRHKQIDIPTNEILDEVEEIRKQFKKKEVI